MGKEWENPTSIGCAAARCGELISLQQELISPSCTIAGERLFELPHPVRRRQYLSLLLWVESYPIVFVILHHTARSPKGDTREMPVQTVPLSTEIQSNPGTRVTQHGHSLPCRPFFVAVSTGFAPAPCGLGDTVVFVCPSCFVCPCCPPLLSGFHKFGSRPWVVAHNQSRRPL